MSVIKEFSHHIHQYLQTQKASALGGLHLIFGQTLTGGHKAYNVDSANSIARSPFK